MKNPKPFHRRIAIVLLAIFLPSLLPVNLLYASNNGPNAFEAASFEPVDAADMVNLVTGDMSYTMPLINVPSPEGGYPLTLSYKAGIAMDQEASWVGLGWNLNPGAINRSVNGFADDVQKGTNETFIYDQGGSQDYYSAGIGGNINGITVGVGAYWGSNKTFGGSVTFGVGPAVGTVGTGSMGTSIGVGYASTVDDLVNNVSNGVSFESFKKQGTGFSSNGSGVSSDISSISAGDYDVRTTTEQYGGFGIYYGHTKIEYSLYKEAFDVFSGILYPYKIFQNDNPYYLNKTFDTNKLIFHNFDNDNVFNVNTTNSRSFNSSILPNFDRYSLNSQGISGSITPSFNEETQMFYKNYYPAYYFPFKNDFNLLDTNLKLNTKLFFEFENTNSSFLRIDRSNISRNSSAEADLPTAYVPDFKTALVATTNTSNLYNENTTSEGELLKNGNRKRTGQYIESFTNAQITSNAINLIEAKNLNRNDITTYEPNAIGAFRVTDTDGKTYHYSLPVINFQTWYKNFGNPNNENGEFYLTETSNPYATDWLLTAVTGPDYVDINNNKVVDVADYGYWVEFDYGKWTDGYIWQSSSGENDLVQGDFKDNNRYEYYRGRKQVYYLDAVRTRTHTAYFVKSLRKDGQSKKVEQFTSKVTNINSFNAFTNSLSYTSAHYDNWSYSTGKTPAIPVPGELYNMPTDTYNGHDISQIYGYKKSFFYLDFPSNYSLKLDKIILLNNKSNIFIDKANGASLTNINKAYYSRNRVFEVTQAVFWFGANRQVTNEMNGTYYTNVNPLKEIEINNSSNIIDQSDLSGLNITDKALKIINFDYDPNYTLMPNSPNSTAPNKGKLTLNSIDFLGKKGVAFMPKYQFRYNFPVSSFDVNNEDGWGYNKSIPTSWSLSEIITPTGGRLRIDYETDDYNAVASLSSRIFSKGLSFYIYKNTATDELYFKVTKNPAEVSTTNANFDNFADYFTFEEKPTLEMFICRRSKYGGHYRHVQLNINGLKGQVSSVDQNSVTFRLPNGLASWNFDRQDEGWILGRNFSNTDVRFQDGSFDGVIMRDPGYNTCPEWRSSYNNDDVSFHYKLASSVTPNKGKGGGIRVKAISMVQNGQVESTQKYYYNNPAFDKETSSLNYKSSGSTSFVPYKEPVILPYASELPSPVVLYNNVTVENYGKNTTDLLAKTVYTFETLKGFHRINNYLYSLGDKLTIQKVQDDDVVPNVKFSRIEIKNKFNDLGRLLSIKQFNNKSQLLSSQKLNYKINLDGQGETGVKQESFIERSRISNNGVKYNVNSTSRIFYPNKIESISQTSNGYTNTTYYDKYDFLTGQVLESRGITSDGKAYKTKTIPAYTKYSGMSSKVDNINNFNMLSQTAASYSYLLDNGEWKETGVGITTWNNEWVYQDVGGNTSTPTAVKEKIWRKHKFYTWNGLTDTNGIFLNYNTTTGSGDDGFVWTVGVGTVQPNQWKQLSEVTLYDHYSMLLEVKDVNGNKAATKMDVDDTKIIATGNAGYNEMYYTGAETYTGGGFWIGQEIRNTNGTISNEKAHTGKFSIKTTSASQFGVFMRNGHRPGKYKISVWAHKDNYQKARLRWFNNDAGNTFEFNGEKYFAGDWVLLTHYTDLHFMNNASAYWYVNSLDNTTVYYDDLMIRPIASSITGYVYNEYDELTHIIGNNGLATRFEYDAGGRLVKTYVEILDDTANGVTGGFKLSAQNKINYKNLN